MYDEQLTSLKTHIAQLQEDFGEFENLNELKEMVFTVNHLLYDIPKDIKDTYL